MEGSSGIGNAWSSAQSKLGVGSAGGVVGGAGSGYSGKIGADITSIENFVSFDPKDTRRSNLSNPSASSGQSNSWAVRAQRQASHQEAIVFVVGGGNYLEYQNLMSLSQQLGANSGVKVSITYGSTNIINPESFIQQLEHLQSQS